MFEKCPQNLYPYVVQDLVTGSMYHSWPDVCRCGDGLVHLHENSCSDEPHPSALGCCPLGTCHPMCSQVTDDGLDRYCHCACHG